MSAARVRVRALAREGCLRLRQALRQLVSDSRQYGQANLPDGFQPSAAGLLLRWTVVLAAALLAVCALVGALMWFRPRGPVFVEEADRCLEALRDRPTACGWRIGEVWCVREEPPDATPLVLAEARFAPHGTGRFQTQEYLADDPDAGPVARVRFREMDFAGTLPADGRRVTGRLRGRPAACLQHLLEHQLHRSPFAGVSTPPPA